MKGSGHGHRRCLLKSYPAPHPRGRLTTSLFVGGNIRSKQLEIDSFQLSKTFARLCSDLGTLLILILRLAHHRSTRQRRNFFPKAFLQRFQSHNCVSKHQKHPSHMLSGSLSPRFYTVAVTSPRQEKLPILLIFSFFY